MKNLIIHLNKAFENRIRLGVMSILMVHEWEDFTMLKDTLEVTDGNLASHINALEKLKYLDVRKSFIGKKPNTSFAVSKEGRKAFQDHLTALEALIKNKG